MNQNKIKGYLYFLDPCTLYHDHYADMTREKKKKRKVKKKVKMKPKKRKKPGIKSRRKKVKTAKRENNLPPYISPYAKGGPSEAGDILLFLCILFIVGSVIIGLAG